MAASWQNLISIETPEIFSPEKEAVFALANKSLIKVHGPDAKKFLQGQLSCDVEQVTPSLSSMGSHSTPKGRMIASFRILSPEENTYLLLLDHSIETTALKQLQKYIVFSKADAEVEQNLVCLGFTGNKACAFVSEYFQLALPSEPFEQQSIDETLCIKVSNTPDTYYLIATEDKINNLLSQLPESVASTHNQQDTYIQQQSGLAFVAESTQDELIPQMLNYQALPAISFQKGCYTGQEIIARMQYLGKLKRRMRHFILETNIPLSTGMDIYKASSNNAIGKLVSCIKTNANTWDVLMVITEEDASAPAFLTENKETIAVREEISLPYTLPEK